MKDDPEIYFQKLQAIANEQDKAKLTTLAMEFAHTLTRLPKIDTEIQQLLAETRPLDYDGLVSRIEPSLIQATALLEEIDFLPTALKDDEDLSHFTETALQQVTLRTVTSVDQRFRQHCEETKQAHADAAAREAKRIAEEKAEAERKAKAEAKRIADEKAAAERKAKEEAKRKAAEEKQKAEAEAKRIAQAKAAAKKKAKEEAALKRAIPSEMIAIPAGTFTMGNVKGRDDVEGGGFSFEEPAHKVKVESFLIGKYPVTFAEFDAYCELSGFSQPNDSGWGRGSRPVINVSWNDIQQYIDWLKEVTGQQWRLPSEAEWEYAARGGNDKTAYPWGQKAEAPYANYGNSVGRTTPVGEYPPNGFGLYDMHGNVWEWCQDGWHDDYQGAPDTGIVWAGGGSRVYRGGSWGFDA